MTKSQNSSSSYSIAIHGGAGENPDKVKDRADASKKSMTDILEAGRGLLESGGAALDVAIHCAKMMEDDPLYNAGYGAVANEDGIFELDASIMDGATLQAGAVACVTDIKNPVEAARLVMEQSPHVMIAGPSAVEFARKNGIAMVTQDYFAKARAGQTLGVEESFEDHEEKHGTIGVVVRDTTGNLAAATSTGGWEGKMAGRIGDSPIIGAGNFAANDSGAVSCTGIGEDFIRTVLARYACFQIEEKDMSAREATETAMHYLVQKANGMGGIIMIDKNGEVGIAQSSKMMRCGWIENGGKAEVALTAPIIVER